MHHNVYSLFIGRWQPFHKGHKALIDTVLKEGKKVCIAIRDTKMSKDNPYSIKERKKMIRKVYPDKNKVHIITLPDIDRIVFGRNVGYNIEKIILDDSLQKISATSIRDKLNRYAKVNRIKKGKVRLLDSNELISEDNK